MGKPRSVDYLEQSLALAKEQLPGWAWAMIHQAARSHAGGKASGTGIAKQITSPPASFDDARVVFVVAEPSELEQARGKLLVGPDGVTFDAVYLKALGLERQEVAVCTVGCLEGADCALPIVALGKAAKAALGVKAAATMPHPTAIRRLGDSGEVERKARALKKQLTKRALQADNGTEPPAESTSTVTVEIAKADEDKRIVYGVVLDPYAVDAHGDIIPPAEVEQTAHGWMAKSRIVGLQHSGLANAVPVESWLVPYPTDKDYRAAMAGEPHQASRMKFGADTVHSGTWVIGTKLGEKEWAAVKEGNINAYSIGGFGKRQKIAEGDMPKVEFLEADGG